MGLKELRRAHGTLAEQGTGTLRARDEAIAAYKAMQANVVLAESSLEKATIRAPLDGVLGMRSVMDALSFLLGRQHHKLGAS